MARWRTACKWIAHTHSAQHGCHLMFCTCRHPGLDEALQQPLSVPCPTHASGVHTHLNVLVCRSQHKHPRRLWRLPKLLAGGEHVPHMGRRLQAQPADSSQSGSSSNGAGTLQMNGTWATVTEGRQEVHTWSCTRMTSSAFVRQAAALRTAKSAGPAGRHCSRCCMRAPSRWELGSWTTMRGALKRTAGRP